MGKYYINKLSLYGNAIQIKSVRKLISGIDDKDQKVCIDFKREIFQLRRTNNSWSNLSWGPEWSSQVKGTEDEEDLNFWTYKAVPINHIGFLSSCFSEITFVLEIENCEINLCQNIWRYVFNNGSLIYEGYKDLLHFPSLSWVTQDNIGKLGGGELMAKLISFIPPNNQVVEQFEKNFKIGFY